MFYLIDKKKGISSFAAIRQWAREKGIKKVGHTGTLDPLATGLLLIATDDDTRLIDYIDKGVKSYIATMKLGYDSDTLDIEGNVIKVNEKWNDDEVKKVIRSFEKTYDQMPPDFSAKKVDGKRAYALAREGKEIKLKPSTVTISKISNIDKIDEETYRFEVEVSRGTYIRSLIKDIGEVLGTKAIMSDLVRNKLIGLDLSNINQEVFARDIIKLETIEIKELKDLFNGKEVKIEAVDNKYAVEYKEDIIGIVDIKNNKVEDRKLFGKKYERLMHESN